MREIVLDTETTGLDPKSGHRIVEIGCIELHHHLPTGHVFHQYINPERGMPQEAFAVHGLSEAFLRTHPTMRDIIAPFLEFIGNDPLIIHNAGFDMKFLNAECQWANKEIIQNNRIIDTLHMARKKFPGSPASLDALCRRFDINLQHREKHGALLDATLLAEVYLHLIGGRQPVLELSHKARSVIDIQIKIERIHRAPRQFGINSEDMNLHKHLVASLKNPLWKKAL